MANSSTVDLDVWLRTSGKACNRSEVYIKVNPWAAFPSIFILTAASLFGTGGNVLVLLAIATWRRLRRHTESVFLINLAISDLYVTTVVDPMSLIGKYLNFT